MVDNHSAIEALEAQAAEHKAQEEQAQTQEQSKAAQTPQKQEPTALDGFIGGLTGARKKSGQGVAYNVADTLGNQLNKQASKAISRGLMGVIKNLFK